MTLHQNTLNICQHIHRLELHTFLNFISCIYWSNDKQGRYLISDINVQNRKYTGVTHKQGFRDTCYVATATQKIKTYTILVNGHVHTLKNQNKNNDFCPDKVALKHHLTNY